MPIAYGETSHRMSLGAFLDTPAIQGIAARSGYRIPRLDETADDAEPLVPFVNHGRWICWCPDCHGQAEDVWEAHPYLFCFRCGNASVGGRWRPLRMPEQHAEIVAALEGLPRHEQHYDPDAGIELPELAASDENGGGP